MFVMSKGYPVPLGDANLVLAALKLTSDERSLHVHLVETVVASQDVGICVRCGMAAASGKQFG